MKDRETRYKPSVRKLARKLVEMGEIAASTDVPLGSLAQAWVREQYAQGMSASEIEKRLDSVVLADSIIRMIPKDQRRTREEASSLSLRKIWDEPKKREERKAKIHTPENTARRSKRARELHEQGVISSEKGRLSKIDTTRRRHKLAFGEEYKRLKELLDQGHTAEEISKLIENETGIFYRPSSINGIIHKRLPGIPKRIRGPKSRQSETVQIPEIQQILQEDKIQICLDVLSGLSPLYADIVRRIRGEKISLKSIAKKYPSPIKAGATYTNEAIRQMQNGIINDLLYAARYSGLLPWPSQNG